jgi:thiamine-phosphate pyrophosphorylase
MPGVRGRSLLHSAVKGQRCYITDRHAAGGMHRLKAAVERNIRAGVDYLQVREKDLPVRELAELVRAVVALAEGLKTAVLVNDRLDVAIACGAAGVHLRSDSVGVMRLRGVVPPNFVISVSCHTLQDLEEAAGADFALFGPVFPTVKGPGLGLPALAHACKAATLPVFALGGITFDCEEECIEAGAAGIAGIRLFQ